jgi:hypothetical protein
VSVSADGKTAIVGGNADNAGVGAAWVFAGAAGQTPPTLSLPANITAEVTSVSGATVTYLASASDVVDGSVPVSCNPVSGSTFALGSTTVQCSATNSHLDTSTGSFTITVRDTTPPALFLPTNITTDATSASGATVTYLASASDLAGGSVPVNCTPVSGSTFVIGSTIVQCSATDAHLNTATGSFRVTVRETMPVVIAVTGPSAPQPVGSSVAVSAAFIDAGVNDTHTASIDWGDGTSDAGAVSESLGTGAVSASHVYTVAGVYAVTVTVTDNTALSAFGTYQYVVVYDPSGGFVTGGGRLNSPAGAYVANSSLTGTATFGFVSKYLKGATVPTGNTEFQFSVAHFNFHATAIEWLVISGAKGQYKGSGTVNGSGNYGFILTATDGAISGGGGSDKFRIKIWDANGGGVVYDNMIDAPDTADPSTVIGGGDIVIHK